jgi:hypothetical protein
MRTAANISQKRAVGRYYSQKCGRSLFWESRNELHGFYAAEVRTDVVCYRAQPQTLVIEVADAFRRYTSDREDILADGTIEIVEVKNVFDAERDPYYTLKLEQVGEFYRSRGQSFRILERAEIEAQPRFEAVELIQAFRRTVITLADIFSVYDLFAAHDTRSLAEVRALWENSALGFAKMCALMVRRNISIDLDQGLTDATPVRLINRSGAQDAN